MLDLQSRLVFDELPQQCTDKGVACAGGVYLLDGEGLDAAMKVLDSRKPMSSNLDRSIKLKFRYKFSRVNSNSILNLL